MTESKLTESEIEMVKGYWAGSDSVSERPPKDCSPAFKHGWLNGRDDRVGKPRACASVLRARAEMIINNSGGGNE